MPFLSEAEVEGSLTAQFQGLGYSHESDASIGPDGSASERESYGDVILLRRLTAAIERLNPLIPEEARADALRKVFQTETPNLVTENQRIHKLLTEGVPVEFYGSDGTIRGGSIRLIDFDNSENNDWVCVNQFTVIEGGANRRPDVVVFLNGLPVAVIELKNPGDGNATLTGAYNQLQTYKAQIPSLFRTNAVLVISDGLTARVGSLTADAERFMPWRTTDGRKVASKGVPELPTLIEGIFEKRRFLDLLKDFVVFRYGTEVTKVLAGYHQFHAVQKAVRETILASGTGGNRKIGVIWHTQGSGKSLLMAFYAGQIVKHAAMQNPTLVVITDRNDLDDQLFGTFASCADLIRQVPVQATGRDDLKAKLAVASGGVIFTTMQKFAPEKGETTFSLLTDRRNVVVIADEAHRSQYGFGARVDAKSGQISYGFAKYLHDALPNASFIGFTGTPIEKEDVNTRAVFGDYIDVYDISRAVEDGATVPIYYESRLARIELDEDEKPWIDAEIEALTEDEAMEEQERLKRKWATIEALVGSEKRLEMISEDLVRHFEDRSAALGGKGMIVCMSRRICVALYNAITKLRPDWHSSDDTQGAVKIVMTGAATDPADWQPHIGNKARRDLIAKRAKAPFDPLKLVIVRDMWLTGFDAPCMHTMYIDKPMQGHGLMQAIARVNRVFKDKPAGLIVDYIGIAQSLKSALGQYSPGDRKEVEMDPSAAEAVLREKYEIVRAMFHGFDYLTALQGTPIERLKMMASAIEWVLDFQQKAAAQETTEEGKKKAHRRFDDAVVMLTKAFNLASATDFARSVREEVGFFQTIRAALTKSTPGSEMSAIARDLVVQQIVSRSVISTEIVDILRVAGIKTPDISILSDEFLAEVQAMDRPNLALEALRKLIAGEVRARSRTNIVETRAFSERLDAAIARYHSNALTTAEVLQELIALAREIRASRQRGEEQGLSPEEIAFYDALAENESAVEVMGDQNLRVIAHELLVSIKSNLSVDWMHRESARARLRVLVKRILRKYGYPPDLQDAAIQTVIQQAEVLSARWAH
ncbi:type I restriction endonuclease subunit R [Microvirga massiliensis]|uniref:type I restriction endonuclease subunit R n=1 Tax=Microvirga massiliensis TaxID=1033741 RepID=UPI00062B6A0D|nr:type I restriction endonuclease subunit R [Microvirga massiliensis]